MKIADMHCDTISRLYDLRVSGRKGETLAANCGHLDLGRMKKGGYVLQNFALFTQMTKVTDPFAHCMDLLSLFYEEMERNRAVIRPAVTGGQVQENLKAGLMTAFLTVEEGGVCGGNLDKLKLFYDRGVRMMTLTWNYENELAFPNRIDWSTGRCVPETERGLKPAGIRFVEEMNRMGMVIDVSHLGDKGIDDVLRLSKRPVAASHSNARSLASHPRNLKDDHVRAIAEGGGIIGVNFCAAFLRDWRPGERRGSRLEDITAHMRRLADLGGADAVALGTDFDGITDELEADGAGDMGLLEDAMRRRGFSSSEIDGICSGNVLRFYSENFT